MTSWMEKPVKGMLLDIMGVLCDSEPSGVRTVEGSIEAVKKLHAANIPIRFVTNETQCTRDVLIEKLAHYGFNIEHNEVFSPVPAACTLMRERNLRPHLLVHPDVLPDFAGIDTNDPNCVIVGDAGEHFTFDNVNKAFQALMQLKKPILMAMGKGKYYKYEGNLTIDVGPYVAALEYASNLKAEIIGKPSATFFSQALHDMNVKPEEAIMIGDDLVYDVGGAQAAGIRGILVRSGKFRVSDETHPEVKPDAIVDNLLAAVNLILNHVK